MQLIVISGLPGTGKPSLADALGRNLGVPVFAAEKPSTASGSRTDSATFRGGPNSSGAKSKGLKATSHLGTKRGSSSTRSSHGPRL